MRKSRGLGDVYKRQEEENKDVKKFPMVLFLNYYSFTLLEFHRKVTVIYLNFQPYKRRKKHVRVFGKSRTCFLENTYMKSNKYYGVSIQLPINGLHIGLSKRAYCIICF